MEIRGLRVVGKGMPVGQVLNDIKGPHPITAGSDQSQRAAAESIQLSQNNNKYDFAKEVKPVMSNAQQKLMKIVETENESEDGASDIEGHLPVDKNACRPWRLSEPATVCPQSFLLEVGSFSRSRMSGGQGHDIYVRNGRNVDH